MKTAWDNYYGDPEERESILSRGGLVLEWIACEVCGRWPAEHLITPTIGEEFALCTRHYVEAVTR